MINDNFSTTTRQVADTGQGAGSTNTRGKYFGYMGSSVGYLAGANSKTSLMPGFVNTTDPSAYIENDHANLDGKTVVDGHTALIVMTGAHLNGYGAFLAKQSATSATLNAVAA